MKQLTRRNLLTLSAAAAFNAGLAARLSAAERTRFRLAVTTDEIDDDLNVAAAFLQRFGVTHCEIRKYWGKYNTSQPIERAREARKILDGSGIRLAVLDTGFFKVPPPDSATIKGKEVLEKQWALLDKAFERADILGADLIRTFAFTHPKGRAPDPSRYSWIFERVEESAERAGKAGFRLAIENVGNSYVATAAHAAKLLQAVKHPALGLTWDPNNSAGSGDPEPYPAGYKLLDPKRIYHVHFRDYKYRPDGGADWCGVGDGDFDHVGQLRAFLRDGYQGAVSLETHFEIDGSKAKASEYSLKGLLKAVAQV